jgi:Transposase DDE domain
LPFKNLADRRHDIPKQRHRVTNWAAYDAGLRGRGSLTIWFTEAAIATWRAAPRTSRGGQPRYSALAITTALTLRAVFRLALRQTEGLIGSIIALLGLDLAIPDHSTLSRRAELLALPRLQPVTVPVDLLVDSTGLRLCGPGEWLVEKAWFAETTRMAETASRYGCQYRPDRREPRRPAQCRVRLRRQSKSGDAAAAPACRLE